MNPNFLKIITLIAQGASSVLLPGAAPFINAIATGANQLNDLIAAEARFRGVSPDALAATLIAELETSLPETARRIEERRKRIEES